MKNKETIISITYILAGSMLLVFNDLLDGWMAKLLVLIGYILYFSGLNKLILGLDDIGVQGAKNIKTGIIIGIIGLLIDYIPLLGFIAVFFYMLSFVFQLLGLLKLKKSESTGDEGRKGINYILTAVFLGIIQGLVSFLPFVGGFIVFFIGILYIVFIIIGWINVQKGIYSKLDENY